MALCRAAAGFGVREIGGDLRGHAMVERRRVDRVEDGGGRAGDETIKQHRRLLDAGGEDRPDHRRDLPAAKPAQDLEADPQMFAVRRDRGANRSALTVDARVVAAADPIAGAPP